MKARVCLLFLVLIQTLIQGETTGDIDNKFTTHVRTRRGIFTDTWRRWTGPRSSCGSPDACPPHHCRLDDAVVHGFCCGCAHPTDRVQVRCPPWLKCPFSPIPLCDDYNFMMDCCC